MADESDDPAIEESKPRDAVKPKGAATGGLGGKSRSKSSPEASVEGSSSPEASVEGSAESAPAKGRRRAPAAEKEHVMLEVAGRELRVSSPSKLYFPEPRLTKLDLVRYYVECHEAVLVHLRERPTVMKRWVDGVEGKPFFQKRVPESAPEWLQTAVVKFPSGRTARELVADDAAHLVWGANLGVIDWNPWPVRRADLDHPDELRIDLDPEPDVPFDQVRQVALGVREVLEEHRLRGFPKTSGSRGIHVLVRTPPTRAFHELRRAALALAREVERRMPGLATTRWWKEQREGVFIDYNQNARDRTVASAYSVRAVPDARVSCPLEWDEIPDVDPAELRLDTVPARLRERGDPAAEIDAHPGALDSLLELADRDEREGLGDAPWPPHFRKQRGEPRRVQPSRAQKGDGKPDASTGRKAVAGKAVAGKAVAGKAVAGKASAGKAAAGGKPSTGAAVKAGAEGEEP
ncbi:MAG TPA: DNA primase small subunit domain-containing protein [Solirubrobacteraceae bacterium]|nr:DNA primase small subunit domain-containing protein [Solirubrobacteraceae bacterium]